MKKYICIILVCVIIGLLVVSFTSTPDSVENPIDKPPAIDFATTPPPTISEKTEFGDDDEIKNEEDDKKEDAEKAAMKYYTIKSGDTLGRIAINNGTTVNALCRLNGITPKTTLKIGRRIRVR